MTVVYVLWIVVVPSPRASLNTSKDACIQFPCSGKPLTSGRYSPSIASRILLCNPKVWQRTTVAAEKWLALKYMWFVILHASVARQPSGDNHLRSSSPVHLTSSYFYTSINTTEASTYSVSLSRTIKFITLCSHISVGFTLVGEALSVTRRYQLPAPEHHHQ